MLQIVASRGCAIGFHLREAVRKEKNARDEVHMIEADVVRGDGRLRAAVGKVSTWKDIHIIVCLFDAVLLLHLFHLLPFLRIFLLPSKFRFTLLRNWITEFKLFTNR